MFGRQDDQSMQRSGETVADGPIQNALKTVAAKPPQKVITPNGPAPAKSAPPMPPAASASPDWQHPGAPMDNNRTDMTDLVAPSTNLGTPSSATASAASTASLSTSVEPSSPSAPSPAIAKPIVPEDTLNDLLQIKQQALSNLSPLIGQLDQLPEDRFRTLMMMIQASDDHSLVKEAYAAAQTIEDEKTHAQALLDIVNEINYFTSQH